METGKACLKGDSVRTATRSEVEKLKDENLRLKELLANQALENQIFKKFDCVERGRYRVLVSCFYIENDHFLPNFFPENSLCVYAVFFHISPPGIRLFPGWHGFTGGRVLMLPGTQ